MATKPMKTPGAPGAGMRRSPLAPVLGQVKGTGMKVDDVSASGVFQAGIRAARPGSAADNDSALGQKGVRGRSATNASAQFRITASRAPYQEGPYPGTLAAGKVLPSVMGSRQRLNFDQDRAYYSR